jgi:hypothetical protein
MSKESPQNPQQVVKDIEQGSARVNELATELSRRIITFEDWLNRLPGRVETYHWVGLPKDPHDHRDPGLGLRLARSAKRWTLWFAYSDMSEEGDVSWAPLAEADLETKMLAIKEFSDLLVKIKKAQDGRVHELRESLDAFQMFAQAVGIPVEGEGK